MPGKPIHIGTRITQSDHDALAEWAAEEGATPADLYRRIISKALAQRQGTSKREQIILAELLAFKRTLIELSTAHLRGVDITSEKALQIEAGFNSIKYQLAELAMEDAEFDG